MSNKYFVTGIGTGIGKTLVSTILVEKLGADYWKPIQSGDLMQSDSLFVEKWISNSRTTIYPEAYRLSQPLSPHWSAKLDGVEIDLQRIEIPRTTNQLIIEGAGGLLVPLNDKELLIDLIESFDAEVIIVSQNYLGSINHTLLTVQALQQRNINIKGIIFNGDENLETENYILNYTKVPCLGKIPHLNNLSKDSIIAAGENLLIG